MDRVDWEKKQRSKAERKEIERRLRGYGGPIGRPIHRPRRADNTMMSDAEIIAQEGKGHETQKTA